MTGKKEECFSKFEVMVKWTKKNGDLDSELQNIVSGIVSQYAGHIDKDLPVRSKVTKLRDFEEWFKKKMEKCFKTEWYVRMLICSPSEMDAFRKRAYDYLKSSVVSQIDTWHQEASKQVTEPIIGASGLS